MKPIYKPAEFISIEIDKDYKITARDQLGRRLKVKVNSNLQKIVDIFVRDVPVGTVLPNGTVYAGISPHTGKPFYAAPQDAPDLMTWSNSIKYAKSSYLMGIPDWRIPTRDELCIMFNNRAEIGNFTHIDTYYWASDLPSSVVTAMPTVMLSLIVV